jgi:hypothetical protein
MAKLEWYWIVIPLVIIGLYLVYTGNFFCLGVCGISGSAATDISQCAANLGDNEGAAACIQSPATYASIISGTYDTPATAYPQTVDSLGWNNIPSKITVTVPQNEVIHARCWCKYYPCKMYETSDPCTASGCSGTLIYSFTAADPRTGREPPVQITVPKTFTCWGKESSTDFAYGVVSVVYSSGGTCNTAADTDCNGQLIKSELLNYLQKYINNQIIKQELLNALQAWVNGGGL